MTSSPDSRIPSEYESTLAVVSDAPAEIRAEIAALSCLGRHEVVHADLVRIRDVYLDTPSGDLRIKHWALRLRFTRGSVSFALKGPATRTAWGGIERPELDAPWSREAPYRITRTLTDHGIPFDLRRSPGIDMPPVEALKRAGLLTIQQRETIREVKRVIGTSSRSPIAELALDGVSYYFGKQEVRHIEVEIEAKDLASAQEAKEVTEYLLALFPSALRPWDYGKLATGLALQDLLKAGDLAEMIRPDHYLKPSAYRLLEDYLDRAEGEPRG
jgi:inorganic triphosphatase YgiF